MKPQSSVSTPLPNYRVLEAELFEEFPELKKLVEQYEEAALASKKASGIKNIFKPPSP